ncbi:MAG: DUF2279 domain-containing protein, partial [Thermoanaerobaculia bacterium]
EENPARAFPPQDVGFSLQASLPPLEPPDFLATAREAAADSQEEPAARAAPRPKKTRAILVTAGVLVGSAISTSSGIRSHGAEAFHGAHEYWFGKHTYAGGADKASHLVLYNGLARELSIGYARMNYPQDRAYLMAFSTTLAAGLITEIGDGFTVFGFSYEDLLTDAIGAGTAVYVSKHGLGDVVGFRFGPVPNELPRPCCPVTEVGKDYSTEIYTGDLKIAGVAKRLRFNPGPARFLLLSFTYGSKGYRNSLPEFREQQVGVEIGVNFPEILTAIGVKDTTWWGRCLFIFFNVVRVPYTQIGYRYDVIHGRWYGPNIGEKYDPGPGIPPR